MTATLYTESPTLKQRQRTYMANGYTFQMVQVPRGSFLFQGDHEITFPADFELGQYPVTQGLWEAVMRKNPSRFKRPDRPVERVSWDDIMGAEDGKKQDADKLGFLDRLNGLPEIAALNATEGCCFGLPSETQWEYAERGGGYGMVTRSEYAGSNYLPEVGWYDDNSQGQTHPVGRKLPNALGLYDMSGNVSEWCEDVWQDSYKDTPEDGSPLLKEVEKNRRVIRGGSWDVIDRGSRVAFRFKYFAGNRYEDVGFRLFR